MDADEQRRRRGQPGADVPQGEARRARSTTSRKGAFNRRSGEEPRTTRRAADAKPTRARVARRRAAPQDHRAAFQGEGGKDGYEIVGEVKRRGDGRLGVRRPVRRPAGAAAARTAIPTSVADGRPRAGLGARDVGARRRTASSPGKDVGETEGTGIVHIAPGCGKERLRARARRSGLPPVAPLDDDGRVPRRLRPADGQDRRSTRRPPTRSSTELKKKGRLLRDASATSTRYPHCWRCKTELLFRLVDEWFIDMKHGAARS